MDGSLISHLAHSRRRRLVGTYAEQEVDKRPKRDPRPTCKTCISIRLAIKGLHDFSQIERDVQEATAKQYGPS